MPSSLATECRPTIQVNVVPCVDLPYISSLGTFIHALLLRAYVPYR